jgi:ring-1,2-phenylacetyl-CoA epoxidase subunit PaaB
MYGDPSDPGPDPAGTPPEMPHYTRDWHFDPYHQRLAFARQRAPGHVPGDTEWPVWEVFQQEKRGEHHQHVGAVHAPDADLALVLAKESFARRGACVNLWVVRADHVFATDYADADVFEHSTDKSYREPGGFQGLRRDKIHGHRRAEEEGDRDDEH